MPKLKSKRKRRLQSIRIKEVAKEGGSGGDDVSVASKYGTSSWERSDGGGDVTSEYATSSWESDYSRASGDSDESIVPEDEAEEEIVEFEEETLKLDCNQLSQFLLDISAEHGEYDVYQLMMKFAYHMGSALSQVSHFHWLKMEKKRSDIDRVILGIPLNKVPNDILEVSRNWLNQLSVEDIEFCALRSLENICYTLGRIHLGRESSQVQFGYIFVLQMVLQCKPDVLISVWPKLEEFTKHWCKKKDRNLLLAWVISQALPVKRFVAEFMWVKYLYPLLIDGSATGYSEALNYKVMESFGGFTYLNIDEVDDVFGNTGESALPRSIIEHLARSAFSANSKQARESSLEINDLVEGYWAMNCRVHKHAPEVAERIADSLIPFAIKASGEDNFDLAEEARRLFLWCLTNNTDSFKQWDDMYLENLAGSVFILKKLSGKWRKLLLENPCILSPLMRTMASFVSKNEKALESERDAARQVALKKALRYSKTILGPAITLDNFAAFHFETSFLHQAVSEVAEKDDTTNSNRELQAILSWGPFQQLLTSRASADSTNDSASSVDDGLLEDLGTYVTDVFCEVEYKWLVSEENPFYDHRIVRRMTEVPLSTVPGEVYDTLTKLLNKVSVGALESFVSKTLEDILWSLLQRANQVASAVAVRIFVLAMVLQCKPDVLISVWPKVEADTKYQKQDKIIVLAWLISQARPGDWIVAVLNKIGADYFPSLLCGYESDISSTASSKVLDVICRVGGFSHPYIDEHAMPSSVIEKMARSAYANSTRDTDAMEARYCCLLMISWCFRTDYDYDVEAACKQLIPFFLKAAGEDNHGLAKVVRRIFIRCLESNLSSFIEWDNAYLENLEGSAYILRHLSVKWRRILLKKRWFLEPLMKCMKSFVSKNDKALSSERDAARRATLVKAQKYAKTILGPAITLDWENLDWLVLKEAQEYEARV